MRRALYFVTFAILAVVAAALTVRAQHTVTVLVAARDLRSGTQVRPQDVQAERMHDDAVPSGALRQGDGAVGRWVAFPIAAGEPVLDRLLRSRRSAAQLTSGMGVPDGYRAVAVPVQPAGAVGGMLAAGDRVDVYATPQAGRTAPSAAQPGAEQPGPGATLLATDVLVLELRSDQGQALDTAEGDVVHGLNFGAGKLGSVVLAVPSADVGSFAVASAADVMYLALSVS